MCGSNALRSMEGYIDVNNAEDCPVVLELRKSLQEEDPLSVKPDGLNFVSFLPPEFLLFDTYVSDEVFDKKMFSWFLDRTLSAYFSHVEDIEEKLSSRISLERSRMSTPMLWSDGLELRGWKTREWGIVLFVWGKQRDSHYADVFGNDVFDRDDRFELVLGDDVKPLFDLSRSVFERMRDFLTEEVRIVEDVEPPAKPYEDRPKARVVPAKAAYTPPETFYLISESPFGW